MTWNQTAHINIYIVNSGLWTLLKAFRAERYIVKQNPTSEYIHYIPCKNCTAIFNNIKHPPRTKLHVNV